MVRTAWEYDTVLVDTHPISLTELNRLGAEGWEMCGVVFEERTYFGIRQTQYRYYIKRPKEADTTI